ncbi:MAG: hypothetical protein ACPGVG_15540 [Mycobacterium sp.]
MKQSMRAVIGALALIAVSPPILAQEDKAVPDFIPSTTLTPDSYFRFSFTREAEGLIPLPLAVAVIGIQTAASAVSDVPIPTSNPDEAAALFGPGSELSLMIDKVFETGALFGQQPRVWAVPLADPAGSATATPLTIAGLATADGFIRIEIAGVLIDAQVRNGDSASQAAQSLRDAVLASIRRVPVTASEAAGVVTLTNNFNGVHGNDVVVRAIATVPGLTVTLGVATPGTGTASPVGALANLLAVDVNGVILPHHTSVEVQAASDHADVAWEPGRKRWRHMHFGTTGDNSAAGALGAINTFKVLVTAFENASSMPSQIAAVMGTLPYCTENPNFNWSGYDRLPLIGPSSVADRYSPIDIEELLALGVTPLVISEERPDRASVIRLVTTQTALGSPAIPTTQLLDASVTLVTAYSARQLDASYKISFGPDSRGPRIINEELLDRVRRMIIATLRAIERAGFIRDVDERKASIAVYEPVPTVPGRIVADVPLEPTPQLFQVAFDVQVFS